MLVGKRAISICRGLGDAPLDFHWWRAGELSRVYGRNSMAMGVKRRYIASGGHFWRGATYHLVVVIAYRLKEFVWVIVNGVGISGIGQLPRLILTVGRVNWRIGGMLWGVRSRGIACALYRRRVQLLLWC